MPDLPRFDSATSFSRLARQAPAYPPRPHLLIFVVAYHAESTIDEVLTRIPTAIAEMYDTEVLVLDDASTDLTFERASIVRLPFPLTVLSSAKAQTFSATPRLVTQNAGPHHPWPMVLRGHVIPEPQPNRTPQLNRRTKNRLPQQSVAVLGRDDSTRAVSGRTACRYSLSRSQRIGMATRAAASQKYARQPACRGLAHPRVRGTRRPELDVARENVEAEENGKQLC